MNQWEIFNPYTGEIKYRVPFAWIAKLMTDWNNRNGEYSAHPFLDYARKGQGYL